MTQPITTDHGAYNFVRVYKGQSSRDPVTKQPIGMNGGIGELDSGAWVWYPQCLPISNPQQAIRLLDSINPEGTARFKRWWTAEQQRLEQVALEPVARPIKIVKCDDAPGSKLVYDDGSEEDVADAGEVVAFYKEGGPLQALALQIFGARYRAVQQETIRAELETPRAKMARELAEKRGAKKPGRPPGKATHHYSKAELLRRAARTPVMVAVSGEEGDENGHA